MLVAKPVGRDAAAKKYDILSALASFALSQDKHKQRQVMRLMALITTRYNWQRDELSMGQAEIARLWSVDTRTVKREMAKLRSLGWIVQKTLGARGRVSTYGIDLGLVLSDTRDAWDKIGPDFVARMTGGADVTQPDNVVPFQTGPKPAFRDDLWGQVCATYHESEPAIYQAWVDQLIPSDAGEGQLTLIAPTRFHAAYVMDNMAEKLSYLARRFDPSIRAVDVVSA